MSDSVDVVDRADTLMRRRRSFVAQRTPRLPAEAPTSGPATPTVDASPGRLVEDEEFPTLTDIVSVEAALSDPPAANHFDETQVTALASEIAHAIGQQLANELPSLLESVLTSAAEELRDGITATMEAALRDFIARRKQLRLPLDEADRQD